jgi:hypothetical protein
VLAGQALGLVAPQLQSIGMVRWHAYLLEQDAEVISEFFRLSFTVIDDANHPRIIANHDSRRAAYARRAQVLLAAWSERRWTGCVEVWSK